MSGDATRIRQVLINLLSNATKFSSKGDVKLKVVLEEAKDEKCCVLFSVIDEGIGIKEEDKAYIFRKFTQIGACPFTRHHVRK